MSKLITGQMNRKDVSADELRAALSDLQDLEEEHGEALNIAMLFDHDTIEDLVGTGE